MTATQNPAQDVSDAKAELWRIWAIDGMPKDKQRLAEAAFEIGLMAGIGQSTARELQQCPNCLNDGCHCATCNPYPGELQQAQVVESSTEEEEKSYPICRYCNSENVSCDGTARYDKQANKWELVDTFDGGYCDDCKKDQKSFIWVNTLR